MNIDLKPRFDGNDLKAMLSSVVDLFERNVKVIDALNVFPVPDGDTGTNMMFTLRDLLKAGELIQNADAGEVAEAMARGALMGARGNSGVILSQVFKGIAVALNGHADFGAQELASALELASEYAYKAVGAPVEGTILTVARSAAEAARESADEGQSVQDMLNAACDAARTAVDLTPSLLPVLREAGVVDAGGHGLSIILEGIRQYATGERGDERIILTPGESASVNARELSAEFPIAVEEDLYGYCTQFLVQGHDLNPDTVREQAKSLAKSAVVVGDDTMIKVHVHVHNPAPIIDFAVSLGKLSQVKIENMDEQHREYLIAQHHDVKQESADVDVLPLAIVAVAWGDGLESLFADLGATGILPVGDTMNPSVQEIVDIVESANSDNIIFLPNNKNIVPAATRAIELSKKNLRVIPSTTLPQGIAAILAFNSENDLEKNVSEMERALSSVRTGEVCRAVRPAVLNGVTVTEDQIIGLMERELVTAGDNPTEVVISLLQTAGISEEGLVTLYWGGELTQNEADSARKEVIAIFPDLDVEILHGGQPHYHYIVSIEE